MRGQYEGNYPDETERRLFALIAKGDWPGARQKANEFFDWMVRNYYEDKSDIQLKVLEFVIWAEREAFIPAGPTLRSPPPSRLISSTGIFSPDTCRGTGEHNSKFSPVPAVFRGIFLSASGQPRHIPL